MWPFEDAKTTEIKKIVKNITSFLAKRLKDRGLISLYLAGSILSRKERVPDSEIDFFGIMSLEFYPEDEKKINLTLENLRNSLCGGYECRFRGVFLQELKDGKPVSPMGNIARPERLAQRIPFFKLVWGKKFDYKKYFVKPMKLKEEAEFLISQLTDMMKDLKGGNQEFPIADFPKFIIELVCVEAQLYLGYKYHPGRKRLQRFFRKEENHIIHKAMELRERKAGLIEMVEFCKDIEKYIRNLRKKLRQE